MEKEEDFVTSNNLEMILVKPGTFMMGSPYRKDRTRDENRGERHHKVTITEAFYLGRYEVTQGQWERVMGGNPSKFKGEDRPVENVSWSDAVEFCIKLTEMEKKAGRIPFGMAYQLPTIPMGYACRAGTTTAYSWGDSISVKNASYRRLRDEGTKSVGKHTANPWGFHDMHGNVSGGVQIGTVITQPLPLITQAVRLQTQRDRHRVRSGSIAVVASALTSSACVPPAVRQAPREVATIQLASASVCDR